MGISCHNLLSVNAKSCFSRLKDVLARNEDSEYCFPMILQAMLTGIAVSSDEGDIEGTYSNRGRKLKRGADQVYEGKLGNAPFERHGLRVSS